MPVELDLTKSAQENAASYFEQSKKARKKLKGIETAIKGLQQKIARVEKRSEKIERKKAVKKRKRQWFERFHWFYSSDDFLVLGGRDAQSNETLIKRHMEKTDIYFHADVFGAAHCLIKSKDNKAPENTLKEAAVFAAVFSRAWKDKLAAVDVYSVKPEQVTKKSPSGEALKTGAFMIYGKRKWYRKTALNFAVGLYQEKSQFSLVGGPKSAIQKKGDFWLELKQGDEKTGAVAKKLKKIFEERFPAIRLDLDEIIKILPAGGCEIAEK